MHLWISDAVLYIHLWPCVQHNINGASSKPSWSRCSSSASIKSQDAAVSNEQTNDRGRIPRREIWYPIFLIAFAKSAVVFGELLRYLCVWECVMFSSFLMRSNARFAQSPKSYTHILYSRGLLIARWEVCPRIKCDDCASSLSVALVEWVVDVDAWFRFATICGYGNERIVAEKG